MINRLRRTASQNSVRMWYIMSISSVWCVAMSIFTVRNSRKCKTVERKQLKYNQSDCAFKLTITLVSLNLIPFTLYLWHGGIFTATVELFTVSPNQCHCYLDCFWTKISPRTDTQQISVKSISFLDIYIHCTSYHNICMLTGPWNILSTAACLNYGSTRTWTSSWMIHCTTGHVIEASK